MPLACSIYIIDDDHIRWVLNQTVKAFAKEIYASAEACLKKAARLKKAFIYWILTCPELTALGCCGNRSKTKHRLDELDKSP